MYKPRQVVIDARLETLLAQSAIIQGIKSNYALNSALSLKANVSELNNYQPKGNYVPMSKLVDYSTTVELRTIFQPKGEYLTRSSLDGYLTTDSASSIYQVKGNYATKTEVSDLKTEAAGKYLEKSEANRLYAKASEVVTTSNLADKVDRSELLAYQPKGDYATNSALNDKADRSELVAYQPKGDYATKNDLGSYAKTSALAAYQPKGNYAQTSDLDAYVKTTTLSGYQPKGNYATKEELTSYAKATALAGLQEKGDYATNSNLAVAKESAIQNAKTYTDSKFSSIMGEGVDAAYDTLREIQDILKNDDNLREQLKNLIHAKPSKFVKVVGDNVNHTINVTHNLNTKEIMVNLWTIDTNEMVFTDVKIIDVNTIQLEFGENEIPGVDTFKVIVIG